MLLMIRAFSTRHPAMAFIPDVRLICHWLLFTSLCPSAVQPLERYTDGATLKTAKESARGSQQQMIHRLMIAPTVPPVSQARGRFSVSSKSCYAIITPSGKNRNGLTYTAPLMGAIVLHIVLSTRRAISGGIGKHSKLPPDIRRRPMHSKGGALI